MPSPKVNSSTNCTIISYSIPLECSLSQLVLRKTSIKLKRPNPSSTKPLILYKTIFPPLSVPINSPLAAARFNFLFIPYRRQSWILPLALPLLSLDPFTVPGAGNNNSSSSSSKKSTTTAKLPTAKTALYIVRTKRLMNIMEDERSRAAAEGGSNLRGFGSEVCLVIAASN